MSYWNGHAPNYSRRAAVAAHGVKEAEAALLKVLREEYPLGSRVRVVHYHGAFTATVTGWDTSGVRVAVRNARTGKDSKWWAAQVERIGGAA
ncbi:hypothetical protein ISP17_11285 [Dyella ginsengisoli]|uniref:Uncharacterized protein n=1 Tax=Dyella ginsengisoli TaxID=363848 RepID=A0ABW8JTT6_9GAMM